MSPPPCVRIWVILSLILPFLAGFSSTVLAQNPLLPQGNEYAPAFTLPGEQNYSDVAVRAEGGYVVWQDNMTDGDGLGISAQKLNSNLSGTLSAFRVNEQGTGDQENAKVALLKDGGAVFVWQGGQYGFQRIYARFLGANGAFSTGDIRVNTYTGSQQIHPRVCVLTDGTVVVIWTSYDQDGSIQGVFGQRLSANGQKLGAEFGINQTTRLNQRSSSVAGLANGNFVAVWISEKLRTRLNNRDPNGRILDAAAGADVYDVDVYARLYDGQGAALGDEFIVNTAPRLTANPDVTGGADGGFAVVWWEHVWRTTTATGTKTNGWDIAARTFNADGQAKGESVQVNTETYGDQLTPRIRELDGRYLAVWTSMGQDGSREGVYGQVLNSDGTRSGDEFRVNTTTLSQQLQPAVASDGTGRFLVVWSSYVGGTGSFDLFAQRYTLRDSSQQLPPPAAPYVSALSQSRLSVTWPSLAGYDVAHYELTIDAKEPPVTVSGNMFVLGQLGAGTPHTFQLAYKLSNGKTSPKSDPATGTTWNDDGNFDGLPDDWQLRFWGTKSWPAPTRDGDSDGATNLEEFLAGTDPTNPTSVLRTSITNSSQGRRLNWNTEAGSMYQVQLTTDFEAWTNFSGPRFAAGNTDSVSIGETDEVSIYRVVRLR